MLNTDPRFVRALADLVRQRARLAVASQVGRG